MTYIASALLEMDADIVILVEVEDCCVIDYFMKSFVDPSLMYNYYVIKGTDTYTGLYFHNCHRKEYANVCTKKGQNLALLTRVDPWNDIQRTSLFAAYPTNGTICTSVTTGTQSLSKNLIANFTNIANFPSIVMVAVHLLAQPSNTERCGPREAQAKIIQQTILENMKENIEFIVLGDFNDYDPDVIDMSGHETITNVFQYIKQYMSMVNTAEYINRTLRYTHYTQSLLSIDDNYNENDVCLQFSKSYVEQLDTILVSERLVSMIESVEILNHLCGYFRSDHLPIIVTLRNYSNETFVTAEEDSTIKCHLLSLFIFIYSFFVVCAVL